MEDAGFIEEMESVQSRDPSGRVYCLSYHPVVKVSSSMTRVRPEFDASAKGLNQVSLNDCLNTGPWLNSNLVDVLLKFWLWKTSFMAHISTVYL